MTLKDTLDTLASTITKRPPFCSGTLPISSDAATIFYKEGETHSARWINLLDATYDELESLTRACQPATFGLGEQDVYDESYRKAGKMDTDQFCSKLDVNVQGVVDRVHLQLLEGEDENKVVKAELYKLNVYGKDSFFKSHKDTPRKDTMFGSLVIVFPAPHEGGALILRHDNQEWTFDSASLTRQATEPSVAYIAFYSDVDHEVTRVQSGHRVTLTYNLFFEATTAREKLADSVQPVAADDHIFHDALSAALADPSFLPKGGYLGFGLSFIYPINKVPGKTNSVLKGSDALIYRVCRRLSLSTSLSAVYKYNKRVKVLVPANRLFKGTSIDNGSDILDALLQDCKGRIIRKFEESKEGSAAQTRDADGEDEYINVAWVTPMSTFNQFGTRYIDQYMGNEAGSVCIYADLCVAAKVGPFGDRKTIKEVGGETSQRDHLEQSRHIHRYEKVDQ